MLLLCRASARHCGITVKATITWLMDPWVIRTFQLVGVKWLTATFVQKGDIQGSTNAQVKVKRGDVLQVWTCGKTATIFRHRDAPERLESSETELSSEGSVFNAFPTNMLCLYHTELSLKCRFGGNTPSCLLSIVSFAPFATFRTFSFY